MTKRVAKLSLLSGCSLLFAVSLISSPVQAGFEWVPAQNATPPALLKPQEIIIPEPVYAQPEQMPVVEMHHGDAMPTGGMRHMAVTPEPDAESDAVVDDEMVAMYEEPAMAEPVDEMVSEEEAVIVEDVAVVTYEETMPKQAYATAYGFAKDMPLALALRQIVPASYAFSFETDVNIGTRVSWQGGEPWNTVLKTALGQQNLSATVYDDRILIRNADMQVDIEPVDAPEVVEAVNMSASAAPEALTSVPAYLNVDDSWLAVSGQTLRSVLSGWSDKTGVVLHWENVYDFAVSESWSYEGDYVHAVDALLGAFADETPRPIARLHPNAPEGPAILVVEMADSE